MANIKKDDVLTAPLLADSYGISLRLFPKDYEIYYSQGFLVYCVVLSIFVIGSTVWSVVNALQHADECEATTGEKCGRGAVYFIIVFDVIYLSGVTFFMWWWCPTKVTRNNDNITISFKGARDQVIGLNSIVEIRCIHAFSCKENCDMCQKYACRKCFWGMPTSLLKTLVIVTDSCCTNYQCSMSDAVMTEFLRDNAPHDAEGGSELVQTISNA